MSATSVALLFVALSAPTAAHAKVKREIVENAKPSNLVNIVPVRIEGDVQPGQTSTEQVQVYNDSDKPVSFTTTFVDLGPPKDPTTLGRPLPAGTAEFGAGTWLASELPSTTLAPFEKVTFDLQITPPVDAPVGSSYAGVQFEFGGDEPSADSQGVAIKIVSLMQVLLTVPGDTKHDLVFLDAETRDSFHFGDTGFVSYGLRYRNDGNVSDHVKGKVVVTSLFGNTVKTIDLGERALIRGATGTDRAVWTGLPKFGVFSATAEIKGDDGKVQKKDMGRVVLLPPWWVLALIAAALIIPPIWVWWRRRQEWMMYLDDEYWDQDEDETYA